MAKYLVIVESPTKTKPIQNYLGSDYVVKSSKGHIRDLAIKGKLGLGLDDDLNPIYATIKGKSSVIRELKKEAKDIEHIYLATDHDREGEAISWHLKEVLGVDKPMDRVVFNEITKDAIIEAFKHPRGIDEDLVSSQETRRILDRIIGFRLSKLLMAKIKAKSAGRVQSVTLMMIVDREKEINDFIPEEYWSVKSIFENFEAELTKFNKKKIELNSEDQTTSLVNSLYTDYTVDKLENKTKNRAPKPPFITSTLQQMASTKLGFSLSKTMTVAQQLYEGIQIGKDVVGLITYMRTDSTRLSNSFVASAHDYITNTYSEEYVGKVKGYKKSKDTQDAHEAIRPTSLKYSLDEIKKYLKADQYKLYKLIYTRALASLMANAKIGTTKLTLSNNGAIFTANAQRVVFDGYLKIYKEYEKVEENVLPELKEGTILQHLELQTKQHFTQPKPRYSESTIVKEMKENNIGRPSTYESTIKNLVNKGYIKKNENKKFYPTEIGVEVTESLVKYFDDIINISYTASMENDLDEIALGHTISSEYITEFYNMFIPKVAEVYEIMPKKPDVQTDNICPNCNVNLIIKQSKYGEFEACPNYPDCKHAIFPNKEDETPDEPTGISCPKCGSGEFVKRTAKRGKNKGKHFYACNGFPKCKNILSGEPTSDNCPECGSIIVKTVDDKLVCNNTKECGYKVETD